jgi:ribosomal protein L37AE/L43A
MAVYDDVERRLCEKCGEKRDVRTMSMIGWTGRWICKPCKDSAPDAATLFRARGQG